MLAAIMPLCPMGVSAACLPPWMVHVDSPPLGCLNPEAGFSLYAQDRGSSTSV